MRIVGGKYKGRIFNPGNKFRARPTTDMAKEGLFNILTNRIDFEETEVLDLFSGTGSISLEFISRGCKSVTLVESDSVHFKFILQSISTLDIQNIIPVKTDVFRFLKKNNSKFDLIFADPPFKLKELEKIPDVIFSSEILNPEGIFILEHPKNSHFSTHPNYKETRQYGSVNFSFFNHQN